MATAEFMLNLLNLPELRALIEANIALIKARNGGADVYEAGSEVDAIEKALNDLGITVSCGALDDWNIVRGWPPA